jgi:beta-lactam-binding protein with PASTA domain
MSRGAARNALRKAGLNTGRIHFVASEKPNHVLRQGVPAGSEVKKGTRVDLWVGFKAD